MCRTPFFILVTGLAIMEAMRDAGTNTFYENLSAFVPIEIDAIEATMRERGLQKR